MQTPSLLTLHRAVEDRPPLLRVSLDVDYATKPGALRGISFSLARGEVLGLIGESGSGKSTVAMSVLRLLRRRTATIRGSIEFDGRDLTTLSEGELRTVRGRQIGLVPQSPLASLNPALRIGTQLEEAWNAHRQTTRRQTRTRLLEVLDQVTLPPTDDFLARYPRQLSVGLAQRVLIAMAILHQPSLLIADEPMSALDVITGAEILQLFARLNRELNMAILFISHDLLSVASLCHKVAIMRNGELVEFAPTPKIFSTPSHEYTRALLHALRVGQDWPRSG
jgi:peptide/nickel transport system ATP-binding protein